MPVITTVSFGTIEAMPPFRPCFISCWSWAPLSFASIPLIEVNCVLTFCCRILSCEGPDEFASAAYFATFCAIALLLLEPSPWIKTSNVACGLVCNPLSRLAETNDVDPELPGAAGFP